MFLGQWFLKLPIDAIRRQSVADFFHIRSRNIAELIGLPGVVSCTLNFIQANTDGEN